MAIKLFRSISCITIKEEQKNDKQMLKVNLVAFELMSSWFIIRTFQEQNYNKERENIWKTFSEAIDEEQELLRKLYKDSGQNAIGDTVDDDEQKVNINNKTVQIIAPEKTKSECISDIYQKAIAKLPKFNLNFPSNKNENLVKILISPGKSQQGSKIEKFSSSSVPNLLQTPHKEIYFNADFLEEASITSFNRPLPPIPDIMW